MAKRTKLKKTETPNTAFDLIAVGDKITFHLGEAEKALKASEQAYDEHTTHRRTAAALLLDVAQNHPEYLEELCTRIKLGLSRRKELLAIAGGKKTVEKSRADNTARQRRHRAKKRKSASIKTEPLQGPVTAKSGNGTDPDESADDRKRAYAAAERAEQRQITYLAQDIPSRTVEAVCYVAPTVRSEPKPVNGEIIAAPTNLERALQGLDQWLETFRPLPGIPSYVLANVETARRQLSEYVDAERPVETALQ
jgi:hypothetical protein